MKNISDWVIGRLSEPSSYAAAAAGAESTLEPGTSVEMEAAAQTGSRGLNTPYGGFF